jgi:hypothetical protein
MPKRKPKKPMVNAPLQFEKDEEHKLTEMQAAFVWHYTEGACGMTDAARKAGYEFPGQAANKMLLSASTIRMWLRPFGLNKTSWPRSMRSHHKRLGRCCGRLWRVLTKSGAI